MELQERAAEFERERMVLFAISYDAVPVLAEFAQRYGITYTLLSDEGSHVIRALGLLNTHLDDQAAHYGATVREHYHGVPYPGTFMLDEHGVIRQKRFEQSYRVRPQAVALFEDHAGEIPASAVRATARTPEIAVTAWIAQGTYRPYQRLALHLDLAVAPGLHVYGDPLPDGYTPLTVEIAPLESLDVGPPRWPDPRPFRVAGLDERFVIHEGTVRGTVPLFLARNVGSVELTIGVRYQACSADECHPPDQLTVRFPLEGMDNVRGA
ncbi:MAG: redoxin domain-containing protein [Chloroflexi bacterium]|nr:redoxin domain-containing protein [Chloroflexota bacterium]